MYASILLRSIFGPLFRDNPNSFFIKDMVTSEHPK